MAEGVGQGFFDGVEGQFPDFLARCVGSDAGLEFEVADGFFGYVFSVLLF